MFNKIRKFGCFVFIFIEKKGIINLHWKCSEYIRTFYESKFSIFNFTVL